MITRIVSALALSTLLAPAVSLPASTPPFAPQSRVWIEGTSTVRSFTCKAGRVEGSVEGSSVGSVAEGKHAVQTARVTVPVAALDCGNGTMNEHMRKALRADANPTIEYRLTGYDVSAAAGGSAPVQMKGTLRIAGQEQPIVVPGRVTAENGGLRVRGEKEIQMTQWGVRPPTLMMGTMKVGDKVTVKFDVLVQG